MLHRQEKAIVEEINANKHGAQSYTNKANSIASGYTYYYTPEGSDTEQKMNIVIPDSYISGAINGAGENYSDMMAGIDYILNNIGGITSGQYFTNQDKSNMKNSNSLDTGYNS